MLFRCSDRIGRSWLLAILLARPRACPESQWGSPPHQDDSPAPRHAMGPGTGRNLMAVMLACCACCSSAWMCRSLSSLPRLRPSATCLRPSVARRSALLSVQASSDGSSQGVWREGSVEPGCVLVASPEEVDHFFRHAVVLLLEHSDGGSKGVVLEMATAFMLQEMAPAAFLEHPLGENSLFRGGSSGNDKVIMLHALEDVQTSKPIGRHGVFAGGMQEVKELVSEGRASSDQVKFFFNHCEWLPGQLEREIEQKTWRVGFIPPQLCMRQVSSQSERIKMVEGPRFDSTKNELSQSRKLFFELLLQRILDFRKENDVEGVLALLDAGAEVYERKGAAKIKSVLQEKWSQKPSVAMELKGVELQGGTSVSVKYTLRADGGAQEAFRSDEEVIFSSSGLIRSIRAHG
ncbi:hypothetical protein GUITHDRAFT_103478 [Guillardia theta CCMP2712]|uniref:Uncharacterized protein n=1 Tax=Guillardia theta (strain CCMP2712) TaxID=905079 RepID=L1JRI2_GUITC|nr:hypothetical protein GUITHDRAFT_103478 [Guillardia theta CCMP2712]EKX50894.1 hypothetical protein GUITHDRAFT_103478 [Guillardia theta CCMP2712]|eukprot:XP_005837874.1 hypothetical protein GUITHDRAFT_103478 [Guillardia theta CCMP2712]